MRGARTETETVLPPILDRAPRPPRERGALPSPDTMWADLVTYLRFDGKQSYSPSPLNLRHLWSAAHQCLRSIGKGQQVPNPPSQERVMVERPQAEPVAERP